MLRSLLALALLIPSASATESLPMVIVQPESIVQVLCFGKDTETAGTAFRVGPQFLLSVNHVTSGPEQCFIEGKPINLAWKSPTSDFSELLGDEGPYLPIDCKGFVKGEKYLAVGYGRGLSTLSTIELTATGEYDDRNGEAILVGLLAVIPGQSGGPLISEQTGKVVGVINAENFEDGLSWSVELKNTPICAGRVS
jgi:hypothetical protein